MLKDAPSQTSLTSLLVHSPESFIPHAGKLLIFFPSGKDPQPPPHQVTSRANWLAWKEGKRSLLNGALLKRHLSVSDLLRVLRMWFMGLSIPMSFIFWGKKKSQTGWWKHVYHNFLLNSDKTKCHFCFSPTFFPVHPGLATGTPTKKSET